MIAVITNNEIPLFSTATTGCDFGWRAGSDLVRVGGGGSRVVGGFRGVRGSVRGSVSSVRVAAADAFL
ncbi:hypothetical protein, partial [Nocardia aurea]|uniref:hypothetical protein n=1 Tax=Nocardia aurea TaxID=2144174 RepID=UPI001E2F9D5F